MKKLLSLLLLGSLLLLAGCATGPVEENKNPEMNTAGDSSDEEASEEEPVEESAPAAQPAPADAATPVLEPTPLQ